MYLKPNRTYKGTLQHASRAPFLILVQSKDLPLGPDNFRALVRKVAMRQSGHWMMGRARAFGKTLTISGAYGNDGLPCTVDHDIYERAVPVPRRLYDLWARGGGHNSAGSEAEEFREWAKSLLKERKVD